MLKGLPVVAEARRMLLGMVAVVARFVRRRPAGLRRGCLPRAELEAADRTLLDDAVRTLRSMLVEIEDLQGELPSDALPMGEAARRIVESSIAECHEPFVDAERLAADMQRVGQLTAAMKIRLLLSPREPAQAFVN